MAGNWAENKWPGLPALFAQRAITAPDFRSTVIKPSNQGISSHRSRKRLECGLFSAQAIPWKTRITRATSRSWLAHSATQGRSPRPIKRSGHEHVILTVYLGTCYHQALVFCSILSCLDVGRKWRRLGSDGFGGVTVSTHVRTRTTTFHT